MGRGGKDGRLATSFASTALNEEGHCLGWWNVASPRPTGITVPEDRRVCRFIPELSSSTYLGTSIHITGLVVSSGCLRTSNSTHNELFQNMPPFHLVLLQRTVVSEVHQVLFDYRPVWLRNASLFLQSSHRGCLIPSALSTWGFLQLTIIQEIPWSIEALQTKFLGTAGIFMAKLSFPLPLQP